MTSKRPPTAYNFVTKDTALKERLRLEHPDWTHQEMMSEFSRLWTEGFSEEEKQKYFDQAKEARDNWSPPDDTKKEITQIAKRAQSAYLHFAASRREELKKENPSLKITEMSKIIGNEWKELSEDEKQPFIEKHEKEKLDLLENPVYREKKIKKHKVDRSESDEVVYLQTLITSLRNEITELSKLVNILAKEKLNKV